MNPGIVSVRIIQIGSVVAARIIAMKVRAIHREQMPALRCVDCQFRRLCRSLSTGRKETELDTHFTLRSNRQ